MQIDVIASTMIQKDLLLYWDVDIGFWKWVVKNDHIELASLTIISKFVNNNNNNLF